MSMRVGLQEKQIHKSSARMQELNLIQVIHTNSVCFPSYRLKRAVFTDKQCKDLVQLAYVTGRFYRSEYDEQKRSTRYIQPDEAGWLYKKLSTIFSRNNVWKFALHGIFDPVRVIEYKRGDFLGPHSDVDYSTHDNIAKLTALIGLSCPSEYEGGIFILGNERVKIRLNLGDVLVFPTFLIHEVTRITKGRRIVAASWASGPPFV